MPRKMDQDHSPCQCQTYTQTHTETRTHTHRACMSFCQSESNMFLHLSAFLFTFCCIFLLLFLRSSLSPFCLSGQRRTVLYGERLIFPPFPSLAGILTESWLYGNKENCSLITEGEGEKNLSYMLWQTLVEKLQQNS